MDKASWQGIKQADFAMPADCSRTELTRELLGYLGTVDAELRDDIAYAVLGMWIDRGEYAPDEMRAFAVQMRANLQVGLGEQETDTVFLRAFSILILAEIVARDSQDRFLSQAEVRDLMDAGLAYLAAERDLRGYVAEKGWAHAVAHTADFVYVLAQHQALGAEELQALLTAVAGRLLTPTPYRFLEHEEERLVTAVLAVLRRGLLPLSVVAGWLEALGTHREWRGVYGMSPERIAGANCEGFLKTLYVALSCREPRVPLAAELLPLVQGTLARFMPRFYGATQG